MRSRFGAGEAHSIHYGPGLRRTIGGYAVAGASVAGAVAVSLGLEALGVHVFLFAFYAAVVGSAWIGTGPGCLAVTLSVLAVQYFFTPPAWGFEILAADVPFITTFVVCAVMSLAWSSQRKRAERSLEA